MSEKFIIANRTDVGKVREVNEDFMATFDSPNGRVVVVCDGMGGQAAGDIASRLACDIITDILTNNTFASPTEAITRACLAANQGIVHRASQNPNLEGMGATCVMVIIKDGLVYYGWVGDSRIYYITNNGIRQLSHDQSYVQHLVDSGQITEQEAKNHPQKNEILNALGLATMTPPALCTSPLQPAPGSTLLLCSDGLSGMVDDEIIRTIVSDKDATLQQKADKLVNVACGNGGNDNITVQLIYFGQKSGAVAPRAKKQSKAWIFAAVVVILAIIAFVWFFTKEEKPQNEVTIEATVNKIPQNKTIEINQNSASKKSSTQRPPTKQVQQPVHKPAQTSTAKPSIKPVQQPVHKPTQSSTQKPPTKPAQQPVHKPAQKAPTQKPTNQSTPKKETLPPNRPKTKESFQDVIINNPKPKNDNVGKESESNKLKDAIKDK